MNNYKSMKEKQQKEFNEFPMFFAFSDEQFEEGMKKLGLNPSETDKIYKFGGTGGFYRKENATLLHEMLKRHDEEMNNAIKNDDEFIFDMFNYELGNHEYIVTYDVSDTLSALGFTIDEVNNDKRLSDALQRACKAQKEWYAING